MGNEPLKLVREKYLYYKDVHTDTRVVTICLLKDENGNVSRGVAICSARDNSMKSEGRKWAKKRALSAMYSRGQADKLEVKSPNFWEATKWVGDLNWLKFKCEYNPELTDDQDRILG